MMKKWSPKLLTCQSEDDTNASIQECDTLGGQQVQKSLIEMTMTWEVSRTQVQQEEDREGERPIVGFSCLSITMCIIYILGNE